PIIKDDLHDQPSERSIGSNGVSKGMRKIAGAIKMFGPSDKKRLGTLLGISTKGTTVLEYARRLVRGGYAVRLDDGRYDLTATGHALAADAEAPPATRDALIDAWRQRIGTGGMRVMFDYVVAHGRATLEDF